MRLKWLGGMTLLLVIVLLVGCGGVSQEDEVVVVVKEKNFELQVRGNGTAELVTTPVRQGISSAKLTIPRDYSFGDAARLAVPLHGLTLDEINALSFWCCIDAETPLNPDGTYWGPYITFEMDTDGEPGCDTWIIGGGLPATRNSSVWVKDVLESGELFYVSTLVHGYVSPFSVVNMGTLDEIRMAMSPDGATTLGGCTVTRVRVAIGNWGVGGPLGPVICYVDHLVCNGELIS